MNPSSFINKMGINCSKICNTGKTKPPTFKTYSNRYFSSPLILYFLFSFSIISCQSDKTTERKISSSGKSSELLVVINDVVWESQIGDTIFNFFSQDMPGLSTSEPRFDVVHIPPHALSKMFQTHRNILILEAEKSLDSAVVEFRLDVWSQPQSVVKIRYRDQDAFIKAFGRYNQRMMAFYEEAEMNRIVKAFKNVENLKIRNSLQKKMGISLSFPTGFYIGKEDADFVWLRQITQDYNMEVMVHVFRYSDTSVFNPDYVMNLRDQLGRKYIPGPADSTWMGTERLIRPEALQLQFNGMYATETRGLWKVMNYGGMGGPYLNYTMLDEKTNRIIFLDGFVYYPNKEKRDLMRQLEGIFRSIQLIR